MTRRQAIRAGTFVAGMAWIAPVLEPVHLTSSVAEAASGQQLNEPRPATEAWHDPKTPDPGFSDPKATDPVAADPDNRVVRVLSESTTRESAGASQTARATPASVNFVG